MLIQSADLNMHPLVSFLIRSAPVHMHGGNRSNLRWLFFVLEWLSLTAPVCHENTCCSEANEHGTVLCVPFVSDIEMCEGNQGKTKKEIEEGLVRGGGDGQVCGKEERKEIKKEW